MDMPLEAQRDTTLSVNARFVLGALWRYAGREKRFVWPSAATLATDTGMAERTVQRHLRALEHARWIERDGRGWVLCDPPGEPVKHGESQASELAEDGESSVSEMAECVPEVAANDGRPATSDRKSASTGGRISTGTNQEHSLSERECTASSDARVTPPITEADREARVRHVIAEFRERCQWELERPKPPGAENILGILTVGERHLRELIEMGETADSLIATATKVRDQVESGELPPKFWGPLSFTGFYGALRDGQALDGISKPAKGPSVDTAAEARAWAAEHDGRLPSDWEWQPDGHGHHEPVRRRGA